MSEHLPLNISPLPVKLRIGDYLLLDDAGAFDGYRKTELIEEEVLFMNAQHRPHVRIKSRLHVLLAEALRSHGGGLEAIVEGSIAIPPINVPGPDIVVTSEAEGKGLVPLESVHLIVEVADATLKNDLTVKAAVHARHGVPEYWVVDVEGRAIHQMSAPDGEEYRERRKIGLGRRIEAVTLTGLAVATEGVG
ncbi:MAG: Uma2 family endonuclease [Allosphingosinicella sp.]|uniref:Uma2 family endonuclease n=1 Tax=Allosphingosinicella sp. TaxID=2823234 RepID=UPI0039550030